MGHGPECVTESKISALLVRLNLLHPRDTGASYKILISNLIFLLIPIVFGISGHGKLLSYLITCVLVSILFLGAPLIYPWPLFAQVMWCAVFAVVFVAMGFIFAPYWVALFYYSTYLTTTIATVLPYRWAQVGIIMATIPGVTLPLLAGVSGIPPLLMTVFACIIGLVLNGEIKNDIAQKRLVESQQQNAILAVSAERERIGRDLHDILGHSLTAIAVKADLAGKLLSRDLAAAAAHIVEIQETARQALADVRATASGLREVRLATEIANARSVLESAGVRCEVPSALPGFSDELSTVFGHVVREAVTNVARHADATVCTIRVGQYLVSVSDDGCGFPGPGTRTGSGLQGLRDRLHAVAGTLTVSSDKSGTTITAKVPQ